MSKKLISTVCLVALMVLVLSSVASSQCGWVLWLKTEYTAKKPADSGVYWKIIEAFPVYEQCLEARKRVWEGKKKQAVEEKEKHGQIRKIMDSPYSSIGVSFIDSHPVLFGRTVELYCLPGTLDPRERK